MSIRRKLVSNTIYLFLNWFSVTILSLLFWFILGKILLPEEYGIVSVSTSLMILLPGISSLGFMAVTTKLIPDYQERKQHSKIIPLIRFALKITLLSNLIFMISILSFSHFFSSLLNIPVNVIWIIGITLIIFAISRLFISILHGFQNMKKIAITNFFGHSIKVVATAVLIFLGLNYIGALIGYSLAFLSISLLMFNSIPFKNGSKKIKEKEIIINYALPAFFAGLAWIIFNRSQYIILNILKNPEETGIFTLAMLLTSQIGIIPGILSNALFPITSQLSVFRNVKKRQSYLIKLVIRYGLFISLPIAIFLILFSKPIILVFSRVEYLPASEYFPILALSLLVYGCGNVLLNSLYAIGKTKIQRNIMVMTSLVFLLLSIPLTFYFSGFGMSLAYSISVIFLSVISFFYIKKFLRFNLPWKSIKKLIIACMISFSFLFIVSYLIQDLLIGIIFTVITSFIYLIVLIPLKFYIEEDVKLIGFIAEKSPILKKELNKFKNFLSKFIDVPDQRPA